MSISTQVLLPAGLLVPRPTPNVLIRRNRGYLLLLILLPIIIVLQVIFWTRLMPGLYTEADTARKEQLAKNQQQILDALDQCRQDTGGVPAKRLKVLQQYGVAPGDLTPGSNTHRWRGPYLPAGSRFPANPYRPHDGVEGWTYSVKNNGGMVTPANQQ
ncbi:MAG: hypothetical protein ACYDBB_18670 [Armatimonadota bacterium]